MKWLEIWPSISPGTSDFRLNRCQSTVWLGKCRRWCRKGAGCLTETLRSHAGESVTMSVCSLGSHILLKTESHSQLLCHLPELVQCEQRQRCPFSHHSLSLFYFRCGIWKLKYLHIQSPFCSLKPRELRGERSNLLRCVNVQRNLNVI